MTTSASQNHSVPFGLLPSGKLLWTFRILCATALSLSGYLAWTALNQVPVYGCGGGEVFDCGHVLTSKYAKVFGMPVSVPAVALYLSLLSVLAFFRPETPEKLLRAGWSLLTFGAIAAALSALWFINIQVFELEHLCAYCLGAHSCGLVLAGIILWKRPLGNWQTSAWSGVSFAAVAVLITAQVTSEAPEHFVVERFDDVQTSETQIADLDRTTDFAPPGDALSSTDDDSLFAPPISDEAVVTDNLFEPPVEFNEPAALPTDDSTTTGTSKPPVTDVSETTPVNTDNNAAETDDEVARKPAPAADPRPTVAAATYLFISPSTASLLIRMIASTDDPALGKQSDNTEDQQADSDNTTQVKDESAADGTEKADQTPATPPKPEPRLVSVSGNRFRLNTRHWPLLGNPDAKYIFVEMFDYTCPHCRNTHHAIDGAFKEYGDDLAVVALPVPLDGSCNDTVRNTSSSHANACELARISVAVWRVNRVKFRDFHNWMFASSRRSSASARQKAEQLVGKAELTAELAKPFAGDYIKRHVDLYKKVGRGSVPKLMFPKSTMTGAVSSTRTLCRTIERELVQK
ncbi:MAG: thioredoxin domain-containing protein [Fuerstiella sp.]|nr:thioredoxin domain-containing protein [Fuerstiella sp.]MCP4855428.1 thioredoxin domain-containing protein [Fuerstiella sp.]